MKSETTTNQLDNILKKTTPDKAEEYLEQYIGTDNPDKPFADYMRRLLKQKGISQQEVFIAADLSESYGYKLIAQEKHTRQRDTIIRLCFASKCTVREANRALKLYGMSPLYAKIPRDAVLIIALNKGIHEIADVDELLASHGMEGLHTAEN